MNFRLLFRRDVIENTCVVMRLVEERKKVMGRMAMAGCRQRRDTSCVHGEARAFESKIWETRRKNHIPHR